MSRLNVDERGILVSCPSCGQANRLTYERLSGASRCGRCRTPLTPPSEPLEVASTADFDRLVAQASLPIVVDYWAPWCGPCRMVAPELVKVAKRSNGRFLVVKVNTDALSDLGERYRIQSIPTMAVFVGGVVKASTAGAPPADDIERFIAQAL